jgi:eukaryotic-like serine/threonine-protein kinase
MSVASFDFLALYVGAIVGAKS